MHVQWRQRLVWGQLRQQAGQIQSIGAQCIVGMLQTGAQRGQVVLQMLDHGTVRDLGQALAPVQHGDLTKGGEQQRGLAHSSFTGQQQGAEPGLMKGLQ